jgi:hypothetical protein
LLLNTNATHELGNFDEKNGYILRLIGSDVFFVRRTNSGETPQNHGAPAGSADFTVTDVNAINFNHRYRLLPGDPSVMEEIVPRSVFTGDKLDGIGTSNHTLSLSNVTMFRIQMGWYGGSACKLMAYVPIDENLPGGAEPKNARWVTMHQINTCDRIPFPSLGNPNLPLTFLITKTGSLAQAVFLKIYGTKAEIDGGDATKYDIFSKASPVVNINPGVTRPLVSIRCKENIVNAQGAVTKNILRVVPLILNLSSASPAKFSLIKNASGLTVSGAIIDPTTSGSAWTSTAQLSAIEYNTTASGIVGGEIISTFFAGAQDGQNLELQEVFRYNREFLTRPISNEAGESGDVLTLVVESIAASGNTVAGSLTWGER